MKSRTQNLLLKKYSFRGLTLTPTCLRTCILCVFANRCMKTVGIRFPHACFCDVGEKNWNQDDPGGYFSTFNVTATNKSEKQLETNTHCINDLISCSAHQGKLHIHINKRAPTSLLHNTHLQTLRIGLKGRGRGFYRRWRVRALSSTAITMREREKRGFKSLIKKKFRRITVVIDLIDQ